MRSLYPIDTLILAGGQSSRMGSDKATYLIDNVRFIDMILNVSKTVEGATYLVSSLPEHRRIGLPIIEDEVPGQGPLMGLYSGLKKSTTEWTLVLSCDVPFVEAKVLELLCNAIAEDADAVIVAARGERMPLVGVYHQRAAQHFEGVLEQGVRGVQRGLEGLRVEVIRLTGALAESVQNINTENDLKNVIYGGNH